MSKKRPSRSEIESALASKTITKKRPLKPLKTPGVHTSSRRRQKVIGGKINGVSAPPKTSTNLLTWVIGILAIMIIGALLIPEPDNKKENHQASMDAIKKIDKIYTESRIPEEAEKTAVADSESFSRTTDAERAKKYRVEEGKEKELTALLDRANGLMEKQRYTKPENDNAYTVYTKILELDTGNFKAEQGIEKIQDYYIARIEANIKSNNLESALRSLESLQPINEDDDLITELKNAIAKKKQNNQQAVEQAKIDKIIKQAETAYKKGDKLSPAKRSALYYYRQALVADQNNKAAKKGIKKISDEYLELANNAIISAEYTTAKGYLSTVLAINPDHPSIPLLEKQIDERQKQALAAAETLATETLATEALKEASQQNNNATSEEPVNTSIIEQPAADEIEPNNSIVNESFTTEQINEQQKNSNTELTLPPGEQANQDTLDLREGLAAYYLGGYDKSLRLLQPLADKGISRAQFRIGFMYQLGRGVETNTSKADNIIRSALPAIQKFASEGRAWAQSDLASLYDDGLVLPKNALKAISWYEKAAYQGYAGAQTNLGLMYYYGKGVRSNRELAIEWFKRAAKQGDVTAKKNLAALGLSVN